MGRPMTADDDLRRDAVELAERVMADPDRRKPSERLLASAVLAARSEPDYSDVPPYARGAVARQEYEAALAVRSDIIQAATGGPDFTPKEWPEPRAHEPLSGLDALRHDIEAEPRAEGLGEAWAAYTTRFADPDDPTRHSETKIRDAFEAGWNAAVMLCHLREGT